ncbi:MAG: aminotransferase class I/II-fold pyridoxal phosphate-dependent enzyme [Gammaproteobacteria bacterium]|nr:aminotransferase class I/II-fold pyridoxal phosphate-dependent enzyme [Gammaproteobacteria bacterium]MDH3857879.1 aminotransferase class I/II-fold pyridoxal phosphate-dependent enzyme [Gammaproteobacteria bacterium]
MSQLRPKQSIDRIKAHMLSAEPGDYPPPAILLNSNESAFGPSQYAVQAARAAATTLHRYLENPASLLAPALARRHGLDARRITIGNGSDELLARLARIYLEPGSEMIRSCNGYLKTPNYAYANGAEPVAAADDDFTPSVDAILAAVTDNTRMVYLANPENPAGTYLGGREIRRLHESLPAKVLLVIDCAYEEYVDADDYESGQHLAGSAENVVMARTFSKIHGLAGARVGWIYAAPEIIDLVTRIGLTFPLASSSLAAALAALDDKPHQAMVFESNRRLRYEFSAAISKLGLRVYPSQTNFVLLNFADAGKTAIECDDYLRRQGIAVRRFAAPAYRDCIRVSIGLEAEMKQTLDAITQFLAA